MRAAVVAVGRHGVGVAAEEQAAGPAELGAGHDVVADPGRPSATGATGSSASTASASAPSARLGEAMSTSSAVRRGGRPSPVPVADRRASDGGAVVAQDVVELGLVVALALGRGA